MQRMVLDERKNGTFHVLSVSPRVDRGTGEHRTDRDGVPQYDIECLRREEDGPAEIVTEAVELPLELWGSKSWGSLRVSVSPRARR